MADNHLTSQVKFVEAISDGAGIAGISLLNGQIVDMFGFDNIMVAVMMGPIITGAVTSMKIQCDSDPAGATMADIQGSLQTIPDNADGRLFIADIIRPVKRYLRVVVSRATQSATVRAHYFLYGSREQPVSQLSDVTIERFIDSPQGVA